MTKFEGWVAACGGVRRTARLIGVSHVSVLMWLQGRNDISRKNRMKILAKAPRDLKEMDLINPSSKRRAKC